VEVFYPPSTREPQLGWPGPRIYIPQEQGGPDIPPGTGFVNKITTTFYICGTAVNISASVASQKTLFREGLSWCTHAQALLTVSAFARQSQPCSLAVHFIDLIKQQLSMSAKQSSPHATHSLQLPLVCQSFNNWRLRLGNEEHGLRTGCWRSKRDEVIKGWRGLHFVMYTKNIIWKFKSRRMRWPGHVARIGKKCSYRVWWEIQNKIYN
jgi:hypothetical protein